MALPNPESATPELELRSTLPLMTDPGTGLRVEETDPQDRKQQGRSEDPESESQFPSSECSLSGFHDSTDEDDTSSTESAQNGSAESDASGLEEERRRVLSRISWEEKRITELQQQKEELMMEMEMEVALLEAELQMEREALQQEEGLIVELKKRHADVELKHQADKEKEKGKLEEERERVEELRRCHSDVQKQLDKQAESMREQLVRRIQESAEALEVAVKAFEDLEFQHLEKESSMEEERETLLRQISSEIAEHQQTVARRKERVLKLKEEVTKMREQTEAQRRRLSEAKSESVKILNAEKGRLLGLPARYSKETGAKSFPDTLQALGKNLSPMKKGRAQMLMDSEKLTGSAPCVLAATTLSILNSQKSPTAEGNSTGSLRRRKSGNSSNAYPDRPVSLHENGKKNWVTWELWETSIQYW
nr:PREDICTED: pleckstrin homology-like domain family B member 3 [Latimeria chalumnae]|eukprot:XP_014348658.1 PREDICTED: pleckstrin homology-like domain family B member 3 [Latimeria chalumnae]